MNRYIEKYIIKTNKHKYILNIKEDEYQYYITVGGNKKTCIEIIVYKNTTTAKLLQIDYSRECNLLENLDSGTGTRDMLITTLYAIKKIFKTNILYITLDDYSLVNCDDKRTPSLLYYNVAFKEKTWYESNFGAVPYGIKLQKKYIKIKEQLNDENEKKNGFEFKKIISHINFKDDIDELCDIYNKSKTFNDFFKNIKENNVVGICIKKYDWIEKIFSLNDMKIPREWIIDLQIYSNEDFVTIEQIL